MSKLRWRKANEKNEICAWVQGRGGQTGCFLRSSGGLCSQKAGDTGKRAERMGQKVQEGRWALFYRSQGSPSRDRQVQGLTYARGRGERHPKKGRSVLCKVVLVKNAFIQAHRSEFKRPSMCRVLKVHRCGFYAWMHEPQSPRAKANEALTAKIREFYDQSMGIYGSPRVLYDFRYAGVACSENCVARLMRAAGIRS